MNFYWQKIKTYWKQLPIESWGSIGITTPLTCLMGAFLANTLLRQKIINAQMSANHTNQSLLQTNRELDQFAYLTPHDLKALLRATASPSEWIEEDLRDSISTEIRSQMKLLRDRVYRMQELLNSLLEYSRSERQQSTITTVDTDKLLTDIIQSLAPPDTFSVEVMSPMPIINTKKQTRLPVFTHLIDNAIWHHPTETGVVKISTVDQRDCYEFTITDDVAGIEPQFQGKIYILFQTLTACDLQEKVGAGLAIVKKSKNCYRRKRKYQTSISIRQQCYFPVYLAETADYQRKYYY
jgi:light-regulated signal transduction histidine kinase (bacteriophytochrome)